MDQDKIGQFIKKLRKQNNLTQAEFGEKYGVTYQAVSKWENGKNIPDVALLKQMSQDFNVNIEDILEGKNNKTFFKKNKILITIIIIMLILLLILIAWFINHDEDFEFKTLSANCDHFNISGSMAYNANKSSIYISNINYCGGNDDTIYQNIECTLYEDNNNTITKISSCDNADKKETSLEDFLQSVQFNIDNYAGSGKYNNNNSLYLEIEATDNDGKITSYKIPLSLKDNSTSS